MSSRGRKKSSVHQKLQQLCSVTNSTAVNKTSIIVDATRYIGELKDKVDKLSQETRTTSPASTSQTPMPMVTVETLDKGFLINVLLEKNCPGLLVSVLETFEELGLDVLEARVSCEETFKLEAIGGENEGNAEGIDAQMVKQAMMQAIRKWDENRQQED
ncbi:transcription factor SCREAM2-like [Hibiscus syriacus]|uniref:transcription factor SCREAM2-like n=1 Tax=Hibiscus syriacus TaxID=106335 RepID=UPI0019246942|nr:transcription factor SCREAM2-like [Hibiscus syriacus]